MTDLTHLGPDGAARMVDVGAKAVSARLAIAGSAVSLEPSTLTRILTGGIAKGEVLQVARLAGIMAAKRTGDLIPLCHPLGLDQVQVRFEVAGEGRLAIAAAARVTGRTGVEMEALTAASVAGLTVYDMCKAVDRGMSLGPNRLLLKVGGKTPWCKIHGAVAAAPDAPPTDGRLELADPGALRPGALALTGVHAPLLPSDCWLVFDSGHRALVVDDGAACELDPQGPAGIPGVGSRVQVRLGDSHGAA